MTKVNFSSIESPIAVSWRLFNSMVRKGVAPTRQKAIAAAVEAGVNKGTAGVQYAKWLAAANAKLAA